MRCAFDMGLDRVAFDLGIEAAHKRILELLARDGHAAAPAQPLEDRPFLGRQVDRFAVQQRDLALRPQGQPAEAALGLGPAIGAAADREDPWANISSRS